MTENQTEAQVLAALVELHDALLDGPCNSGLPDFDGDRLGRAQAAAASLIAKTRGDALTHAVGISRSEMNPESTQQEPV